jgi:HPt (histidine-containing phosphotransfer) domain-containing protein
MTTTARPEVQVASELRDLIPRFLANRRLDVGLLRDALARGDSDAARRVGHSLRGVGGGYGFDEITRIGAEVERLARTGAVEAIRPLVTELESYLERVEIRYV